MTLCTSLEQLCVPVIAASPRCMQGVSGLFPGMASRLVAYALAHTPWQQVSKEEIPGVLPPSMFEANLMPRLIIDSTQLTDDLLEYLAGILPRGMLRELSVVAAYTNFQSGLQQLLKCAATHVQSLTLHHVEIHGSGAELGLGEMRSCFLTKVDLKLYIRNNEWGELATLVRNHPNQLKHIALSIKGVTLLPLDDLFAALTECGSALLSIDLNNFSVEKDALAQFLRVCSNLKSIKLNGSISLDRQTMSDLQNTAQWRQVHLGFQVTPPKETYESLDLFPPGIVDFGLAFGPSIQSVAQSFQIGHGFLKMPNLLALKYNTQLFHSGLVSLILPHGPQLVSLDIGQCDSLTDDGLALILECCPNLEALWIHADMNKTNRKVIGHAFTKYQSKTLRILYINYFKNVFPDALQAMALNFPSLEEVYLAGITGVNDSILEMFAVHCKNLYLLDLRKCWNISDRGITCLAEQMNLRLRELSIANCFRLTDASLEALARNCPNLHCLLCYGTIQMSKPALQHLRDRVVANLKCFKFEWFS